MNSKDERLDSKVKFWAILGPFILLITLFISLVRSSPCCFYMPLAALTGIPICWRWKTQGLWGSCLILAGLFALCYGSMPVEDRFWQVGMALSIAMAFVVTVLSFEEVDHILEEKQAESSSRLNNLLSLDEKLRQLEQEWQNEREDMGVRLRVLTKQNQSQKAKLTISGRVSEKVQKELARLHHQKMRFLEESLQVQGKVMSEERKVTALHRELELMEEKLRLSQGDRERLLETSLEEERAEAVARERTLGTQLSQVAELTTECDALKSKIAELCGDVAAREKEVAREQSEVESLRELVREKEDSVADRERQIQLLQRQHEMLESELEKAGNKQVAPSEVTLLIDQNERLQSTLEEAQERLGEERKEAHQKIQDLRRQLREREESSLQEDVGQLERLKDDRARRIQEMNGLRCNLFQMKLNQAARVSIKSAKKLAIEDMDKREIYQNLRHVEGRYAQLCQQFEERKRVLSQTRKERFHAEDACYLLERDLKDLRTFGDRETQVQWEKELVRAEGLLSEKEEEADHLADIVSSLMGELNGSTEDSTFRMQVMSSV